MQAICEQRRVPGVLANAALGEDKAVLDLGSIVLFEPGENVPQLPGTALRRDIGVKDVIMAGGGALAREVFRRVIVLLTFLGNCSCVEGSEPLELESPMRGECRKAEHCMQAHEKFSGGATVIISIDSIICDF